MLPEIVAVAREVQLPLLAVLLLLGAAAKMTRRAAGTGGLAVLVPQRLRRPSTVATGLLEAALAVGLLGLTGLPGEAARALTAAVFAVSVVVLVLVRRRDPEAGCGCFGGLSRAPVGWRALTRAGLFSAAALAALGVEPAGWQVVLSATPTHGWVAAGELLLLAVLSPELREASARALHREPCELREVSLRRTKRILRRSEVWRTNTPVMTKDEPGDVWRQGCWRLLRYDGERHGRRVDVVYAVRIGGRRRTAVRAVLVDRASGAVVASFGSVAQSRLPAAPRRLPHPREAARSHEEGYDAVRAAQTLRAAREHPMVSALEGSGRDRDVPDGHGPNERGPDGREPDGRQPTPTG
ncbi:MULTISPECIES: MauE/DoxX family redox-associated membrane protein [unclassified Nocardiopsis]|uniref:MauE/DoxX family redox-associated membrane protein n=1 Tax=unclassified Nocardiopsis TaxID=2649073 RepID=UPI001F3D088D|nr:MULTISPECIES: MauE/DoxX family redox-associated membrane protein [unclassified Nocardiopsis]